MSLEIGKLYHDAHGGVVEFEAVSESMGLVSYFDWTPERDKEIGQLCIRPLSDVYEDDYVEVDRDSAVTHAKWETDRIGKLEDEISYHQRFLKRLMKEVEQNGDSD